MNQSTNLLLPVCLCGNQGGKLNLIHGINTIECPKCKITRQSLKLTKQEYTCYYQQDYHKTVYKHDYAHDKEVGSKRLQAYKIKPGSSLLDIGCGNAGFLDAAVEAGVDAYGSEISNDISNHPRIYNDILENIYFPTDYFDYITMHDVLEHLVDPVRTLKEIHRILKQEGTFILDFPRFWNEAGAHHWKLIEHLWMFTDKDIKKLLKENGFEFQKLNHPIKSKSVFYCKKPKQKRISILVPPGIGDSQWAIFKIRSFCEKNKLGIPDVYISTHGKQKRAYEYVKRIPFLNAAGYLQHRDMEDWKNVWYEAYHNDGQTIFEDVEGCDYFISYNGITRHGFGIDERDTQYETEWYPPIFESLEEKAYGKEMKEKFGGEYFVGYFIDHGMYKNKWLAEFSLSQVKTMLAEIYQTTKKPIILLGSDWDRNSFESKLQQKGVVASMVGRTTLPQAFAIMRNSDGMIGFPSGLIFSAVQLGVPVHCFWNGYFNKKFWMNAVPPDVRGKKYIVQDTKSANPKRCARDFILLVDKYRKEEIQESKEEVTMSEEKPDKDKIVDNPPKHYPAKKRDMKKTKKKKVSKKTKVVESTPTRIPDTIPVTQLEKKTERQLIVACVLKSGGDFDEDYVEKLKNMCTRHLSRDFKFVCLTDCPDVEADQIISLKHNAWSRYWCKIELFRPGIFEPRDQVLYFDLDTIIIDDIDSMVGNTRFRMLQSFKNPKSKASGIMSWRRDWSHIYEIFKEDPEKNMKKFKGDQQFIVHVLQEVYKREPGSINDKVNVVSFKKHCTPKSGAPVGSQIVCFHGNPRPHEVNLKWLNNKWK